MQNYNESARVERNSDFGHVWMEISSGASITAEVPRFSAIRVRAAGAVTVTFDGILAATMISGEILIFNSGRGQVAPGAPSASKKTVTMVVTGTAFVQQAANTERDTENQVAQSPVPA